MSKYTPEFEKILDLTNTLEFAHRFMVPKIADAALRDEISGKLQEARNQCKAIADILSKSLRAIR